MSESENEEFTASSSDEEKEFGENISSSEESLTEKSENDDENGGEAEQEYNELEAKIQKIDGYGDLLKPIKNDITNFTKKFMSQSYLNIPLLALAIFFHFSGGKMSESSVTSFINKYNKQKDYNPIDIIRYIRLVESNK